MACLQGPMFCRAAQRGKACKRCIGTCTSKAPRTAGDGDARRTFGNGVESSRRTRTQMMELLLQLLEVPQRSSSKSGSQYFMGLGLRKAMVVGWCLFYTVCVCVCVCCICCCVPEKNENENEKLALPRHCELSTGCMSICIEGMP